MSKIITVPSDVLRKPAEEVKSLDKRVLKVLEDMNKALRSAKDPQGVGLAAPQIGFPLRIFMIRPEPDGEITTFVNAQIDTFSQRTNKPTGKNGVYEGCLSIPHHYAPITRSLSVTVTYQEPVEVNGGWDLKTQTKSFSGFAAHVIQHEVDHLNGILFIDRALEQNAKLYKIVGEDWEEVGI